MSAPSVAALLFLHGGCSYELSGSSALGADEAVSYADLNYAKFVRARAALVLEPCPPP